MQFTFCDESDKQNFDVGTSGEISLILEEHKNVLTLPVDAVHNADGKIMSMFWGKTIFGKQSGLQWDLKVKTTLRLQTDYQRGIW